VSRYDGVGTNANREVGPKLEVAAGVDSQICPGNSDLAIWQVDGDGAAAIVQVADFHAATAGQGAVLVKGGYQVLGGVDAGGVARRACTIDGRRGRYP
jgi:hypothetical protein